MKAEILKENLESFYSFAIGEEINPEVINPTLLEDKYIKEYILEKLTQKAVNYPEFLNLQFKDQRDFDKFNKNLQGEIYRLFLTLTRAARNYKPLSKTKIEHKLEKAVISYLDLKNCYTSSLNAVVSQDGKHTELMDLIPAKSWTTYNESAGMFDEENAEEEIINIKPKYNKRQPAQAETENLQMAFGF